MTDNTNNEIPEVIKYVSLFRLITGEDIISEYETSYISVGSKIVYNLINPSKLIVRRFPSGEVGIALIPWLPEEVLAAGHISVVISDRDVLTKTILRDKMVEFYEQYVRQHRSAMEKNDESLNQNIDQLIKTYETYEKRAIKDDDESYGINGNDTTH